MLSRFNQWRSTLYQKVCKLVIPTLPAEIEFYERQGDYGLARDLAELEGKHEKARELYVLEIGKLVDERKFEDAGRLAEAWGYLYTALEYYKKAGWQPAVTRLEETIRENERMDTFNKR